MKSFLSCFGFCQLKKQRTIRKLSASTQHEATTTLTVISSDESTNETPIPSRSDDYCEYERYNINKEYRRLSTIYEVFDEDI